MKYWAFALFVPALVVAVEPVSIKPPSILDNVGITQRVGESVPMDLSFTDESGRTVPLSSFFRDGKPVLLNLVYYECPSLCTEILNGLVRTLRALPLNPVKDFNIVTVSFDSRETPALAAKKKLAYIDRYRRQKASEGWAFLTGDDASIKALTQAVGFQFAWDKKFEQYAHGSAIMILTPQGKIARYFFGVEYPVQDVRLSLVEAGDGKTGSIVDQIMLYCFHFDPATGRYGVAIMRVLRVTAVATLISMAFFIALMVRREKTQALKEKKA